MEGKETCTADVQQFLHRAHFKLLEIVADDEERVGRCKVFV
jgi:hypothetical protein